MKKARGDWDLLEDWGYGSGCHMIMWPCSLIVQAYSVLSVEGYRDDKQIYIDVAR